MAAPKLKMARHRRRMTDTTQTTNSKVVEWGFLMDLVYILRPRVTIRGCHALL